MPRLKLRRAELVTLPPGLSSFAPLPRDCDEAFCGFFKN
jgi:hypothetical protein